MFSAVDTIWVLLASILVFFMQAGFAMVETGFTRAKNAGNIVMKNLMDFCLGSVVFWALGFGLMFGTDLGGVIGMPDFFVRGDYSTTFHTYTFLMFQTVFCATSATIVSGAMAERTKFASYCVYSVIISALIYPISGHWIWGGGWLAQLNFHDFAGSTAVHMVGGLAALAGAWILGPRIGKYDSEGKAHAIPGHSLTLGALGVFILWFAWFGFNGGSTVSATGDDALIAMGSIIFNTNLAAAVATSATMLLTWFRYGKPDISMTLNGSLGGLVAITAGCDVVSPAGAFWIGLISAPVLVYGIEFIDQKLRVDDPVGAIGVHGLCGALGTILTGVFALEGGLLYGGGAQMVLTQLLGVAATAAWTCGGMLTVFFVIRTVMGLRVSREEELEGLDIREHALVSSYADFMPMSNEAVRFLKAEEATPVVVSSIADASIADVVPTVKAAKIPGPKMSKVEIYANPTKLEALKESLNNIGITGLTVTPVTGCGVQKGKTEFYRGAKVEMTLLPKVRVETVVSKVPVQTVVDAAKSVLFSGAPGDGKIFVYDVENVIRISSGEEGFDALQYDYDRMQEEKGEKEVAQPVS
ncbi:MAG: ammonium transporter [Synergistaceae bacterium]|jgi:Amt family ammonium transporter|nr:ammonium transporter [Synergistaceae bacterium]